MALKSEMDNLVNCRTLKTAMRERCSRSQVIWYDAVTTEGKLKWQNTLNALNRPFFDTCDAIFVNYAWKVTETTQIRLHRWRMISCSLLCLDWT